LEKFAKNWAKTFVVFSPNFKFGIWQKMKLEKSFGKQKKLEKFGIKK